MRGYALIGLLIAVVIIAILVIIMLNGGSSPDESSADRPSGYIGVMIDTIEKARRLSCLNNLRQVAIAITLYRSTSGGKLPDNLNALVEAGSLIDEVLVCPSTKKRAEPGGYVLVDFGDEKPGRSDVIVCEEPGNHAGGGHVLRADGTVGWVSEEELRKIIGE